MSTCEGYSKTRENNTGAVGSLYDVLNPLSLELRKCRLGLNRTEKPLDYKLFTYKYRAINTLF